MNPMYVLYKNTLGFSMIINLKAMVTHEITRPR